MGYCSTSDVVAEFKGITFSSTTSVTSDDVSSFIAQESAVIDGMLAGLYETPVTGTSALLILQKICTLIVAGRVKNILAVKTGDPKLDQNAPGAPMLSAAKMLLDAILSKSLILSDATTTGISPVASYTSTDIGVDYDRHFHLDSDEW
jgi:hypothetical protein